nr:retrotransposon protein, putative, unclassified [Tanacetum cinerariifolium]
MVEKSKLDEDKEGKVVDPSHYHGMTGTLLYLTAGRPDLAICMCARLISWSSKRQKSAAISSTEDKYIALSGCCAQILWMRSQLSDYDPGFNKIPMYCDNKSAIALCCNNVQHSWSKNIDIKYHFIKEHVENGVIELYFVNTEYQLADLFTKALGKDRIEFLINKLGMRSFTPKNLKQLMDEVDETMDTTIKQQAAIDEALVPHAKRLRIGRSNFRLLSNIKSKESTLQLVYDVLRICPFFKAFLMDNKKHIVNLESFRDMLRICPRVHGQTFDEPPFEEEILTFFHFLRHSAAIKTLTDVKHKNTKKTNEMYYTRFTKVIIHHFMSKDLSILRRNKVNWHYVRDDHMFFTIKLVSRHQNMQLFGALLPIELTNEDIRNFNAYKEYYAISIGSAPPKPKASVRRTRSSSDTSITPLTSAASPRLTASAKGKQTAKRPKPKVYLPSLSGSGADEGTDSRPGVSDAPTDEYEEELSWNSTDDEGADDEGKDGDDDDEDDDGDEGDDDDVDQEVVRDDDKDDEKEGGDDEHEFDEDESDKETRDEESFDPIPQNPKNRKDEGNGEKDLGLNIGLDSIFETTSQLDVPTPTVVAPFPIITPTMTPSTIATITTTSQAPILPTTVSSNIIQNLPSFGSLFRSDDKLRIVQQYMDQQMNEAVKVAVQIQSDCLRDEAQRDNDEFLKIVDENMKKIIKEQVKEQVKVQVSKILPRIEQAMNEQLEAKVLTRSSHSSKTSYDVAVDLSEMELKKILIEKIKGNKSIQRSDKQRNLYKALVEAYKSDKIILDTYEKTVTLKRQRDDDVDKDEEPSIGPDRGLKRRRKGKELESASALTKTAIRSAGRSTQGSRSRQASASESTLVEEPMQTTS